MLFFYRLFVFVFLCLSSLLLYLKTLNDSTRFNFGQSGKLKYTALELILFQNRHIIVCRSYLISKKSVNTKQSPVFICGDNPDCKVLTKIIFLGELKNQNFIFPIIKDGFFILQNSIIDLVEVGNKIVWSTRSSVQKFISLLMRWSWWFSTVLKICVPSGWNF